mmetsp:Transcript_1655/g.3023  ORF Transcript_1655/g.3023 Transcript_1655/m.3023 type:complete len:515 (+) Transcript_1655:118-1662(+)
MSEETPTPTTNEQQTPVTSPQKKLTAREKAEARRRRILEKSSDRLSVVYGAPVASDMTPTVAPSSTQVDDGPTDANTQKEEEGEEVENVDVVDQDGQDSKNVEEGAGSAKVDEGSDAVDASVTPSPAKASSSARLAQIRRRYKKAAAENASTTVDGGKSESEEKEVSVATEDVKDAADETTAEDDRDKTSPSGEKKKYMGVAKMRRKLAAEKKKTEEAVIEDELKELEEKIPKILHRKTVTLAPVMIQLFTIVFLFFAGFDVGIQNHAIVKQEVPHVHTNLFYVDHGIGIQKMFGQKKSSASEDILMGLKEEVKIVDEYEEEDEFASGKGKPLGASTEGNNVKENVDPIFGVDFDKLTAGSGFFFTAARLAVSIHRTLTYIFYLWPLSVIHSILSVPRKLVGNPPVFFLCAVIIRYLGKHVLGGNIPNLDEMIEAEVKADKVENEKPDLASTDFVSMGKNFISNFLKGNFPKLVMVYTIFKDARSDMFIVLCGFFVGLIAPTNLLRSTIASEEL